MKPNERVRRELAFPHARRPYSGSGYLLARYMGGEDAVTPHPMFAQTPAQKRAAGWRDGTAVVELKASPGGLVARAVAASAPSREMAGEDGQSVPAEPRGDGDRVVVAAAAVSPPRIVHYLAQKHPGPGLFSREGLPVDPYQCSVTDRSEPSQ